MQSKEFLRKDTTKVRIYEISKDKYLESTRNKTDFTIISAQHKNHKLPYVKCNEILGYTDRQKNNNSINIYHPIEILDPVQVNQFNQNNSKTMMFKSSLTAVTQKDSLNIKPNKTILQGKSRKISQASLNIQNISKSSIKQYSSKQEQQNNKKNYVSELSKMNISKSNYFSENQERNKNLTEVKSKQTKKRMTDSQIINPERGYKYYFQNIQSRALKQKQKQKQKGLSTSRQHIQYKTKLTTLFDLKNSQSQDDLNQSINSDNSSQNSFFNFGKITQSKFLLGLNNVNNSNYYNQSNLKISKLLNTNLYNSVLQANGHQQAQIQDKKQNKRSLNQIQPKRKFSESRINQYRQLNNINNIKLFDEFYQQPPSKSQAIKGLKKRQDRIRQMKYNLNINVQDEINIRNDKFQQKIQTPKFKVSNLFKDDKSFTQNKKQNKSQRLYSLGQTNQDYKIQINQSQTNLTGQDFFGLGLLMILLVKEMAQTKINKQKNIKM